MLSCCKNVVNLGCRFSCGCLDSTLQAPVQGVYEILVLFNNVWKSELVTLNAGDPILICKYNENYSHLIRIFLPDGTMLNNTCYNIKTTIIH